MDARIIARAGIPIIAINQAALWWNEPGLPTLAMYFTQDPNPQQRRYLRNQLPGTQYIAAVPDDYGTPGPKSPNHRGPAEKNVLFLRREKITGEGWASGRTLSEDPRVISSGNSSYGALGFYFLSATKKIAMFGVDGTQEPHGVGVGAPNGSLAHLPDLFRSSVKQLEENVVEVRNGSVNSRVDCFPRDTVERTLEWICR